MNIKKGDTVKVIAGQDKGAEGKVIAVLREEQRVIVEGVNRVKRHTKVVQPGRPRRHHRRHHHHRGPDPRVQRDAASSGKGVTRLGFRRDEVTKRRNDGSTYAAERSVRVSRKTGKEI